MTPQRRATDGVLATAGVEIERLQRSLHRALDQRDAVIAALRIVTEKLEWYARNDPTPTSAVASEALGMARAALAWAAQPVYWGGTHN